MVKISMFLAALAHLGATVALYFVLGDFLYKVSPNHAFIVFGLMMTQFITKFIVQVNANLLSQGDKK